MLHNAIIALFVYIQIGSLLWMFAYCHGALARAYATEPTGSGAALDFVGSALITLAMIAGWPGMLLGLWLIAQRKGKLQ